MLIENFSFLTDQTRYENTRNAPAVSCQSARAHTHTHIYIYLNVPDDNCGCVCFIQRENAIILCRSFSFFMFNLKGMKQTDVNRQ